MENKLIEILAKHKKFLLDEEGGKRANLRGADLRGADLYGADLRDANLRGTNSDFTILLTLNGLRWDILIKDDLVKIGCQEHKYLKWKNFTDNEISKMDDGAIDFYYMIIPVLDYQFKGTKFEIKVGEK